MRHLILLFWTSLIFFLITIPGLAQISYTWNGGDTLWSDPTAWTPIGLPGASDTVLINSGKVMVDNLTEVASLQLSGGTLSADASLSVSISMDWSGGTLEGKNSNPIEIPQGAMLEISGNAIKTLDNAYLINGGAATWSDSGSIAMLNNAILENNSTGTFTIMNDTAITAAPDGGAILNAGTFAKSGSSQTSIIYADFNNTGTANVASGKLLFNNNGSAANAVFNTDANSTLEFFLGNHTFDNVNFNGSGEVTFLEDTVTVENAGATFNTPVILTMSKGEWTANGPVAIDGTFNWKRGALLGSSTFTVNGDLIISGNRNKYLDSTTLTNNSNIIWGGTGPFILSNNAVLENTVSGVFDIQENALMETDTSGGTFTNAGVVTKSAGVDTTIFDLTFINSGTINANTGILQFSRESSSASGAININTGSILEFAAGIHTLEPGVALNGTGTLKVSGDTTNFNPDNNFSGLLEITGGVFNSSSDITLNHPINWLGGQISGSGNLFTGSFLNISGSDLKILDGKTLINQHVATWTGAGNIHLQNNAVFQNQPGATFDIQNNAIMDILYTTGGNLSNLGTMTKSAGSGTTKIDLPFTNSGAINTNSGVLLLARGGTLPSGLLNIAPNGWIAFFGGVYDLGPTLAINGSGNIALLGGTLNFDGILNFNGTLEISDGVFNSSGNLALFGPLKWSGGVIAGSDSIITGNPVTISGDNQKTLDGKIFVNRGAATWSGLGNLQLTNAAGIQNNSGGNFHIQNDATMLGSAQENFANSGTITKSGGADTTNLSLHFENNGTIAIHNGTLKFTETLNNDVSGIIKGTKTLDIASAAFTNSGTVSPGASPGLLTVSGNYSQDSSSVLDIEIGGLAAGSEYDRLAVTNDAQLNGTLDLSFANFFLPAVGDSFEVLTYNSHSDTFAVVNIPLVNGNPVFDYFYESNRLLLVTIYEDSTAAGQGAVNDFAETGEDDAIDINVLENDGDPNGLNINMVGFSAPTNGTTALVNDSTIGYTPFTNFFGADSFSYEISNVIGEHDSAMVYVNVLPVNDIPVLSLPNISFPEDSSYTLNLDLYVFDVESGASEMAWSANVIDAQGSSSAKPFFKGGSGAIEVDTSDLQISIDPLTRVATFSASGDTSGIFTVVFSASDPEGAAGVDTMLTVVTGVSDPPLLINPIADVVYPEDSGEQTVLTDLSARFADPDPNTALSFSVFSDNPDIQVSLSGDTITVLASENYFGSGNMAVTADDGSGISVSDTFMVTITPVNDPPVISGLPDSLVFDADTSLTLNIWEYVEDVETSDTLLTYTFTASSDSLRHNFDNATGELTLSAAPGFSGEVLFNVEVRDDSNAVAVDTIHITVNPVVGINPLSSEIPTDFSLKQNYPNPFNPNTTIAFQVAKTEKVTLTVYNLLGQRIRTLVDKHLEPGNYRAVWDGLNDRGYQMGSGVYIYRMSAGDFLQIKKMILLK